MRQNDTEVPDYNTINRLILEGNFFLKIFDDHREGKSIPNVSISDMYAWHRECKKWATSFGMSVPEEMEYFEFRVGWEDPVSTIVRRTLRTLILFSNKPNDNGGQVLKNVLSDSSYDFALSFAGEDRSLAESLADCLVKNGARVFYDKYEQANLWGKDLYEHLSYVYKDGAKYCIMFLSQHYVKKLWTNHERKSAQVRAFQEQREYILPLRIDDAEVVGVLDTVGFIDLRKSPIQEICTLAMQKLQNQKIA